LGFDTGISPRGREKKEQSRDVFLPERLTPLKMKREKGGSGLFRGCRHWDDVRGGSKKSAAGNNESKQPAYLTSQDQGRLRKWPQVLTKKLGVGVVAQNLKRDWVDVAVASSVPTRRDGHGDDGPRGGMVRTGEKHTQRVEVEGDGPPEGTES